jgi:MoxR-like ATPase
MSQASRAFALLDGRDYVVPDDVKTLAMSICAHRLLTRSLSHNGSTQAAEAVFAEILQTVPVPQ